MEHARLYKVHTFVPPFVLVSLYFAQHWHLEISHEKNNKHNDQWQHKWFKQKRTKQQETTYAKQNCQTEEQCDSMRFKAALKCRSQFAKSYIYGSSIMIKIQRNYGSILNSKRDFNYRPICLNSIMFA